MEDPSNTPKLLFHIFRESLQEPYTIGEFTGKWLTGVFMFLHALTYGLLLSSFTSTKLLTFTIMLHSVMTHLNFKYPPSLGRFDPHLLDRRICSIIDLNGNFSPIVTTVVSLHPLVKTMSTSVLVLLTYLLLLLPILLVILVRFTLLKIA